MFMYHQTKEKKKKKKTHRSGINVLVLFYFLFNSLYVTCGLCFDTNSKAICIIFADLGEPMN